MLEKQIPHVVVTEATTPAETRILPRGNWMDETGDVVAPAIPVFLGKLDTGGKPATRLDLANWLVDPRNPLIAARLRQPRLAAIFRHRHFQDVGRFWLARRMARPSRTAGLAGRRVRAARMAGAGHARLGHAPHRARHRDSARLPAGIRAIATDERDPDNRLLAHQSRYRVDAEMVRDIALSVSGLMAEKFGGPSVKPFEPDGYLIDHEFSQARILRQPWRRPLSPRCLHLLAAQFLHPSLLTFDAPTREECTVNRTTSNTPLQALVLLNDPIYVEASRAFAAGILKHDASLASRIDWAFQKVLDRAPTAEERRIASDLYRTSLEQFRRSPADAARTVESGRSARPARRETRGVGCHDHGGARPVEHARDHHEELTHEALRLRISSACLPQPRVGLRGFAGTEQSAGPGHRCIPRRGESAPSPGQSQAHHLPLSGRRPFAPGNVRQQTEAPRAVHGKPMPESFTKGQQIAQLQGTELHCFGPQYEFKRFGKSGQEICELFPHIGSVADDICIVRSMSTEQINHDPAHTIMNTGSIIPGRPSMGSWVFYGLGADTKDLPGFVVLLSTGRGGQMQPIAARQWSAGLLPSKFQGVKFNSVGDPVLYIQNPPGVNAKTPARFGGRHQPAQPRRIHRPARSRNPDAHRAIRDGVPHANQRPRPYGHEQGTAEGSGRSTAPSRAMGRSPRTVCWRGGWRSAAFASSSFTTAIGTTTAASKPTSPSRPKRPIEPPPPSSPT